MLAVVQLLGIKYAIPATACSADVLTNCKTYQAVVVHGWFTSPVVRTEMDYAFYRAFLPSWPELREGVECGLESLVEVT